MIEVPAFIASREPNAFLPRPGVARAAAHAVQEWSTRRLGNSKFVVDSSAEFGRRHAQLTCVLRLHKVLASPPNVSATRREEGMHGRRLGAALTALALLFTMVVGIAGASDLTPGPLVQVSGTSPFLSLHRRRGRLAVRHGLLEQRGRALDRRQPDETRATWSASSSRTAGRTAARAGVWPAWEPKNGRTSFHGSCRVPKVTRLLGGTAANSGNYQRATDPWVSFGPDGNALPSWSLVLQRRKSPVHRQGGTSTHALLASRSGRTRRADLE